jgi:hypothetical protein
LQRIQSSRFGYRKGDIEIFGTGVASMTKRQNDSATAVH